MTDQFSADKVQAILNDHSMGDGEKIAEIKAMLSTPKRPTLADMPDKDLRTLSLADAILEDDEKIAEISAMLSTPKRPTLADMPDKNRHTLSLADVIRAISEEKDAWGCEERHDRPRKNVTHRTISEDRRDIVNIALLNVLDRLVANLEKA